MTDISLRPIHDDRDCLASFPVMRELRPHLADAASFIARIRRQQAQGYHLLAAWRGDEVMALAGWRVQENLLYGRFLYIDDLVTAAAARGHGLGARLIDALREEARRQDCAQLVLDTALANALGQRFYFRQGLLAQGLHFRQPLAAATSTEVSP